MDNKEYLNAERAASWREALRKSKPNKDRINISRTEMNELTPDYRITCNEEVNQGLTREQALIEASRCLDCPDPLCITGCPVGINIPKFIKNIERGEILEAAKTLKETSALPAVCGRVCPQEKQCESKCFYLQKLKKQPVAIGYLERFAADYERRFRPCRTFICRRHDKKRILGNRIRSSPRNRRRSEIRNPGISSAQPHRRRGNR